LAMIIRDKVEISRYLKREIRCKRCGRLLMKGEVRVVEIKCPRCGCIQRILADNDENKFSNDRGKLKFTRVNNKKEV